jgi:hypothetical protein
MKRILVPTDFALPKKLQVAASIAKKNNCEIFCLI